MPVGSDHPRREFYSDSSSDFLPLRPTGANFPGALDNLRWRWHRLTMLAVPAHVTAVDDVRAAANSQMKMPFCRRCFGLLAGRIERRNADSDRVSIMIGPNWLMRVPARVVPGGGGVVGNSCSVIRWAERKTRQAGCHICLPGFWGTVVAGATANTPNISMSMGEYGCKPIKPAARAMVMRSTAGYAAVLRHRRRNPPAMSPIAPRPAGVRVPGSGTPMTGVGEV